MPSDRTLAEFKANFRVYGVRKVWRQLQREGFDCRPLHGCPPDELQRDAEAQALP